MKRPRGFFIRKEQQAALDVNIQKLPRVSKVDAAPKLPRTAKVNAVPTRPAGAPASFKMPPRTQPPGAFPPQS